NYLFGRCVIDFALGDSFCFHFQARCRRFWVLNFGRLPLPQR
ncbi:unnamed protein product, partial [Arabidopsis halleri]